MRLFRRKRKREVTLSAVIIRKDGKREDLGVIAKGVVEFRPGAK
jgi:hypothetical protein